MVTRPRAPRQQENLSAARPVGTRSRDLQRSPNSTQKEGSIHMEENLRNLSLEEDKKVVTMSQVDGLVDYSDTDDSASDKSSKKTPHIWKVKDSKTWMLNELKKMRKHKDYDEIINYRDDGDTTWHEKMKSIIEVMNKNNIECSDLYNKNHYTSKWVQASGSTTQSPKRSFEEAGLDKAYPEWGVIESKKLSTEHKKEVIDKILLSQINNQLETETKDDHGQAESRTLPPMCEMEPDIMIIKEVQNDPPSKRVRTNTRDTDMNDETCPEIIIVKANEQVFYMIKGASPRTEEEWTTHNMKVRETLRRHGTHKINCDFWRIRGPLSREERMDRVLEFWRAGDIVPRNPFLHKSLRERENKQRSSRDEDLKGYASTGDEDLEGYTPTADEDLAGYAPTGEDGKILDDICELET